VKNKTYEKSSINVEEISKNQKKKPKM